MAKNKMVLGMALAGIALLVLFLFTREGMQPDRKPPVQTAKPAQMQPVAKPRPRMNRQAHQAAIQAQKRAAIIKIWAGMTQEQRQAFLKKHPNFKPPANVPPAVNAKPAAVAPATTQPKAATTTKTAPAPTKTQATTGTTPTQKKTN